MWSPAILVALAVAVFLVRRAFTSRRSLPLPPGPKPSLLWGNLLDIPAVAPWKAFKRYSESSGPLVFLSLPTQPTIIINSAKAAMDLLDKRSQIYSDRLLTVMDELAFVAIILQVVYGKKINSLDDDYLRLVNKSMEGLSQQKVPGAFWVEYFPYLKHIPSWVPGARFKQIAEYYKPYVESMINQPFDEVIAAEAEGKASPSVTRRLVQELQLQPGKNRVYSPEEKTARNVTGIAYAAADTTTSAASSFLTAMAMFPEVQAKARAELDKYVGPDRLPDFDNYDDLVYIRAITLEAMRWIPVVPLGLPHRVMQDDEYEGCLIPKGTIIISNAWAMLRNPEDYPEPERFNPDRFLKDGKLNRDVRDPTTMAFGFGRRYVLQSAFFFRQPTILHVFEIHPGVDDSGKPMELNMEQSTGLVTFPKTIPNGLKPRSATAEKLIREAALDLDE
ncbi:hypothetical protein EIP91_008346 [Steccherinum ochraceum]|uniref:Cytochrome P450 n=1 Tax=Steccherinum ochraceum TaxID=92696 RepID=A0A4R0RPZ1_9APHY|nr:hypothetical protein EIP91_008346 [Steccherinum ochraceum]